MLRMSHGQLDARDFNINREREKQNIETLSNPK